MVLRILTRAMVAVLFVGILGPYARTSSAQSCNPFHTYFGSPDPNCLVGNKVPRFMLSGYCGICAENASIFDNGKVGIGTAAPDYKLTVNGDLWARDAAFGNIGIPSGEVRASYFRISGNMGVGVSNPDVRVAINGTCKATKFLETSDASLKEGVQSIDGALGAVMRLGAVEYTLKDDGETPSRRRRDLGLIAQDVELVLPEVVHTDPDGAKAVAYTRIIPVLLEAIKEQQHRLHDLEESLERAER